MRKPQIPQYYLFYLISLYYKGIHIYICLSSASIRSSRYHIYIQSSKNTLQRIMDAQHSDSAIKTALHNTKRGWTEDDSNNTYFGERGDLSISNEGLLLYRDRLVIPSSLRREMMKKVHGEAHLNLSKCRERIKMTMWWKGISSDIDNWLKNCNFCRIHVCVHISVHYGGITIGSSMGDIII